MRLVRTVRTMPAMVKPSHTLNHLGSLSFGSLLEPKASAPVTPLLPSYLGESWEERLPFVSCFGVLPSLPVFSLGLVVVVFSEEVLVSDLAGGSAAKAVTPLRETARAVTPATAALRIERSMFSLINRKFVVPASIGSEKPDA